MWLQQKQQTAKDAKQASFKAKRKKQKQNQNYKSQDSSVNEYSKVLIQSSEVLAGVKF